MMLGAVLKLIYLITSLDYVVVGSCIGVVGCGGEGKGKGERGNADECPADLLY